MLVINLVKKNIRVLLSKLSCVIGLVITHLMKSQNSVEFVNNIKASSILEPADLKRLSSNNRKKNDQKIELSCLGTIHLRRRHALGGGGVKNWPNLPTDSTKKLLMVGG